MHGLPWYVGLDSYVWLLQGNSDEKLMLSPKRACLAQARLVETGQVHTRALAQVESSRLSEVTSCSSERGSPKRERVGTLACRCSFQPRRGTSPLGEEWPCSSEEGSPKREVA